jgi:hypothetical protein
VQSYNEGANITLAVLHKGRLAMVSWDLGLHQPHGLNRLVFMFCFVSKRDKQLGTKTLSWEYFLLTGVTTMPQYRAPGSQRSSWRNITQPVLVIGSGLERDIGGRVHDWLAVFAARCARLDWLPGRLGRRRPLKNVPWKHNY